MTAASKKVGVLLIGGKHHILHLIPIAAELSKNNQIDVTIFVSDETERDISERILTGLGMKTPNIEIIPSLAILRIASPKLAILFRNIARLLRLDAIIVAERTSTILRKIVRRLPLFIHIPHGAGDRAKSYDSRIRHFDHVLVAGQKDKTRMIDLGLVDESSCHVTGYIKPYAVKQLFPKTPKLFQSDKPIILYNPHFSSLLSSWPDHGMDILSCFSRHPEMNFIVAPHIRLFQTASQAQRDEIEAFNNYPNIRVDLGSERSTNMTYTRAADIYLGDVSSQVYEFLSSPKPCVFFGAKPLYWMDNPDYAHWHYGRVCNSVDEVMTALNRATLEHSEFIDVQREGCRLAVGEPDWNPISRAANVVASLLT